MNPNQSLEESHDQNFNMMLPENFENQYNAVAHDAAQAFDLTNDSPDHV